MTDEADSLIREAEAAMARRNFRVVIELAKQGRVPREDLEDLVGEKLGRWRSEILVDAFVRSGYLFEDESGLIALGWRTHAEVQLQNLVAKLLAAKPGEGAVAELDELQERLGDDR